MASLTITNSFSAGTKIIASEVNTNNTDISTYINDRNSGSADWDFVSSAGLITAKANIRTNDGSAATSAWSFTSQTNLGFSRAASNQLSANVAGVSQVIFGTTSFAVQNSSWQILAKAGSVDAPGFAFNESGRTDDGFRSVSEGVTALVTDGADVLQCGSIGDVTQPLQPSFLVTAPANTANVTGNGVDHTIEFDTEIYDQNSDFNTSTFTFTAPVTGRYLLNVGVRVEDLLDAHTTFSLVIVTSNRNYVTDLDDPIAGPFGVANLNLSVIADMDASDTAFAKINVGGSTQVVEVSSDATRTFFSGSLIN